MDINIVVKDRYCSFNGRAGVEGEDNATVLKFTFNDTWDGFTKNIRFVTPDSVAYDETPLPDTGYALPAELIDVAGVLKFIVVGHKDGVILETIPQMLRIVEGIKPGTATAQTYIDVTALCQQATDAANAATGAVTGTNAAVSVAEGLRVTAESGRATAEETRASNEQARILSENGRVEADKLRGTTVAAIEANYAPRLMGVESQLAEKATKDEVTNVMTPKGTLAYASLPTAGNTIGWYYYCPDGDGTHGAGNYVWNGTAWYFGGTGDEGYNAVKNTITDIVTPHINLLETATKTLNKIYNRGYQDIIDNEYGNLYSLIPIVAGQTYYYRMLYAYFTTIKYTDNSLVSLSNEINTDAHGSFTATMDGTIAITVSNGRTNHIFTTDEEMYNRLIVHSYYTPNKLSTPKEYWVEKDGSGDFTTLVEAINTACEKMDSVVYVGGGVWDLVSELGEDYLNTVTGIKKGLVLKNRVHVIFSSNALVTCHYTGSRADTIWELSAFNAGIYGFTLENARISSSKCRYSLHDERSSDDDDYKNHYINCQFTHNNAAGGYPQCLGGGFGINGRIIIDGCTFDNPNVANLEIVSWHNSFGTGRSSIEIKNSYFKGTNGLRLSWYGQSTDVSTMIAHGNSFGRAIEHRAETSDGSSPNLNTELIEWNNTVRV